MTFGANHTKMQQKWKILFPSTLTFKMPVNQPSTSQYHTPITSINGTLLGSLDLAKRDHLPKKSTTTKEQCAMTLILGICLV
jgi:hypothetical protein